ncbi:hypothetical protein [Prosthecochloris sp. ZM]|uniref:hypothetical protein n=1 Tax=Prosthecochloris sp. ZM TaxID=2283143 RepID=UPI0011C07C21|nr:hypothetical protein [Prosthecochloris sp. ZM]
MRKGFVVFMSSVRELFFRLVSRRIGFGGLMFSFPGLFAVIVLVLFVLLFLSLNAGWLWLAGLIALGAGVSAAMFCFYADGLVGKIGHVRTATLVGTAFSLFLASMAAFAAYDLVLESGLSGFLLLAVLVALFSVALAAAAVLVATSGRVLSGIIALVALVSLIPGNGRVSGTGSVFRNVIGNIVTDSAVDNRYEARHRNAFDEYRSRIEALDAEYRRKRLTASEYSLRRRAVDREYAAYLLDDSARFGDETDMPGFQVRGAFVSNSLRERGLSSHRDRFLTGERILFFYLNYRGSDLGEGSYVLRWLKDNVLISSRSVGLQEGGGELLDSLRYAFVPGFYEIQLMHGDRLLGNTRFSVVEPAVLKLSDLHVLSRNVYPGDMLSLDVEYYFSASGSGSAVPVSEQCVVRRNGLVVMTPEVREVMREEGFSNTSFRIAVPEQASSGTYEAEVVIACDGSTVRRSTFFSVASHNPFRFDDEQSLPGGESSGASGKSGKREVNLDQLGRMLKRLYGN